MNTTQLRKLGVPGACLNAAIQAIQTAISSGAYKGRDVKARLKQIVAAPADYAHDPHFGRFAAQLVGLAERKPREPIGYQTWGDDIEAGCHVQMKQACALPMAVGAALMPDAHVGYGLPIGGVLALDNAVVPYAVGVDIACRMKLSVLDLPVEQLEQRPQLLETALHKCTRFGIGAEHERPQDHPVLDENWSITRITREHKDKARRQLGTSGSGNHFVEFGVLSVPADDAQLGLPAGEYVALLSHSGSRGAGAAVCDVYSRVARTKLPAEFAEIGRLAWLSLDDEAGQEYWAAMNLMGDYAAANHAVIHRLVAEFLGAEIVAGVENHHNFAWKERHGGKEVIVHRKGATPAGDGVLGVIPGSMSAPAFVVRGKGNPASLDSASHGAGRRMSRTAARSQFRFNAVQKELAHAGIRVLSAGADEVPGVYKDIHAVMAAQTDLVEEIARFQPRIVKMSDDPRAED